MKGCVVMKRNESTVLSELREVEKLLELNQRKIDNLLGYHNYLVKRSDSLVTETFDLIEKGYNK